ncbi:predicted protein [Lichtheimia corymbifera JMRC:FSU:9682]|uniref:Uncharacterized protein n=1 Tax=Lichtheimia corymbifera JMRC:FSU:9682 TaxID=1263082 RepID=A0A068RI51_9FUNG|nr:predicted protein [Lichtheimia corymbifera JMRC:FSU:9682]
MHQHHHPRLLLLLASQKIGRHNNKGNGIAITQDQFSPIDCSMIEISNPDRVVMARAQRRSTRRGNQ